MQAMAGKLDFSDRWDRGGCCAYLPQVAVGSDHQKYGDWMLVYLIAGLVRFYICIRDQPWLFDTTKTQLTIRINLLVDTMMAYLGKFASEMPEDNAMVLMQKPDSFWDDAKPPTETWAMFHVATKKTAQEPQQGEADREARVLERQSEQR